MISWSAQVGAVLESLSTTTGHEVAIAATGLLVDGLELALPTLSGERAALFGIAGRLPTVPRGDDRDKLLWRALAEARPEADPTPDRWKPPPLDRTLSAGLPADLPFGDAGARETIAEAMQERFFNSKPVAKVLLPLHGSLPQNYTHSTTTGQPARYRLFSGEILPFLLYDHASGSVDAHLLERLVDLFNSEQDLTALDGLFLDIARGHARDPVDLPSAEHLRDRWEGRVRDDMTAAGGPFCAPSLHLFQQDLATVLDTKLPRPDKVQWLTLLLSLHLGVRLYRLAEVLGSELDSAVAVAAGVEPPPGSGGCACTPGAGLGALQGCPLAGSIRFRTGTGRYRPVARRDGCWSSYLELDQRRLLALPATLVTSNLALLAWSALGGPARAQASLGGLTAALRDDPALRSRHAAACAAIAVLHHATHRPAAPLGELKEASGLTTGRAGLLALREDVLRLRRSDLRHQSRDVVNQLLLDASAGGGGSLISRNGSHTFFEVDERLLLLLVRVVCVDDQLPFDRFLDRLSAYGLAPQDATETAALADALERLGLLVRFSDAGEASFVHYA